jgi:hypothetical protein
MHQKEKNHNNKAVDNSHIVDKPSSKPLATHISIASTNKLNLLRDKFMNDF